MKTIETTGIAGTSGWLMIQVPAGLIPGRHHVVIVVDEALAPEPELPPLNLPAHDVGPWPEGLSLRREDMYGDDGR